MEIFFYKFLYIYFTFIFLHIFIFLTFYFSYVCACVSSQYYLCHNLIMRFAICNYISFWKAAF